MHIVMVRFWARAYREDLEAELMTTLSRQMEDKYGGAAVHSREDRLVGEGEAPALPILVVEERGGRGMKLRVRVLGRNQNQDWYCFSFVLFSFKSWLREVLAHEELHVDFLDRSVTMLGPNPTAHLRLTRRSFHVGSNIICDWSRSTHGVFLALRLPTALDTRCQPEQRRVTLNMLNTSLA
ncbi:uncharacterized protein LY79DRAFT_567850 [Colletotrichum navitas]|uniref:Uncharacterized protein n=1 Tax=Colletotrichum navitas TaxID=681940 RepID=A0AAD8PQC8_9PEZI|nr:uncharacterized protein LY79DRAFT_567850 [Colletotrichum navitas]KAK1573758.1 hypothetical protein LY79DRAFT_567850 [Colletotrichum navitas]